MLNMLNKRRAFTLIELLVVIAIIAILAAILFPVFAQAKLSAKGAASISNTRQETLAGIMYGGDFDDKCVPDMDWGNPNTDMLGWQWNIGECFAPWGWLILPYVKTAEIYQDPLVTRQPLGWDSYAITYSEYPQYGYNYTALSPNFTSVRKWGYDMWTRTPVSFTAVAQPASTVMFTSKNEWEKGDRVGWYWGLGTMWVVRYTVEAPTCNEINPRPRCVSNWGTGSWLSDTVLRGNASNGAFTGGVCYRKSGQAIVGWVDGHASTQTAGALAAGTNWDANISAANLRVTNWSKYQWDIN
jgi:prepilin-type N-terminal cleavage/methylation domain-containing protein/prepilin-type processing-associated H-X9-DG protein